MIDNNIKSVNFTVDDIVETISYELYPISLAGDRYDLTQDFIHLKEERQKINFGLIDDALVEHVKAFFSYAITKYAEVTVFNFCTNIKTHIKVDNSSSDSIEEQIKRIYVDVVNNISQRPELKSTLRVIYRFFADEGMPYFDQDFVDFYLDEMKFGSGNKGLDVLVEMKDRGCLTLSEQRKFKDAVGAFDYKSLSIIELQGFIALRIGQLTGARDIQVRKLKGKHFGKNVKDGKTVYFLKIPRAKQRGQSRNNQTVTRPITQRLGEQIEYLIGVIRSFDIVHNIDEHHLLFLLKPHSTKIVNKTLTGNSLSARILAVTKKLDLDFKVTLRRLRKTYCSSLVARGVSMKVIAHLMDHSDLQQLGVYYRQTHSVAEKIDVILRQEASDILDAFAGKIIKEGEESLKGQSIFAPTKNSKLILIGSCGSGKLCLLNPPLSCYGCKSLEAFEDADHSAILESLTINAKETFGENHALQLAQHKDFIAAGALIQVIEAGDYE
ncbi:tyrosine-type recombinase/integrase [Aliiglaciecola litoralis]|uniref:Tyr recombinase domain-containing protein n=1 Tax=Aliiglaciecola litoralis TaxID=582857 RepID=A0ABP3WXX4_9ALTE